MWTHTLPTPARRAPRWAAVVVAAAALLGTGWFASARADVIVVNGRLAAHASVVKTVAGPGVTPAGAPDDPGDPMAGPAGPAGAAASAGCETGPCRPTEGGADDSEGQAGETMTVSLDDLDAVPDGWLCVPLGGGMELCAPEDAAETLSAFGTFTDDPGELTSGGPKPGAAAGCAGGGAPPFGAALGLALALLAVVLRRRV